jgi:pSer/pThr/pTyr-binding forkhead associated (FHA) protein
MASLHVFLRGKKIHDFLLVPGKECIVGRAATADIVLGEEPGISRQHFKILRVGEDWVVEVLSRYGELYSDEKKVSSLKLRPGIRFQAPPFDFEFYEAPPSVESDQLDLSDRTSIAIQVYQAFLNLFNESGDRVQTFQLEGHLWVGGRDSLSNIFIDNPQFSRKQFEIRLQEGTYLIKDLGSANGTLLNDQPISGSDYAVLRSGDRIKVVDWVLEFEIRDPSFSDQLKQIPSDLQLPVFVASDVAPMSLADPMETACAAEGPQSPLNSKFNQALKKVNYVRLLIYALVVGAGYMYFFTGGSGEVVDDEKVAANKATSNPFEKLNSQQQQFVRDSYRLADRLFKEGRYEMARQEVAKIHELVPSFEESKNLEKLSDVAIQTQIEQKKAEVRERELAEMEIRIQETIAKCQVLLKPSVQISDLDNCLLPIIPLSPDHPSIAQLKAKADQIVAERLQREEKRAEYISMVRKLKSQFAKAEALQRQGKPLEAVSSYEAVLRSGGPDPDQLKIKARRQVASIQKSLIDQQADLERQAAEAQKGGNLRSAILTLQRALLINPENETLKGRIYSLMSELKKQMQALYQEGVLEESVGEVETAKARWRKIVELSIPEEDYYKKAKIKLRKYGAD